ncbi:ATP-grasp peptide maturase system methyltransferase [Streptomyces paromomycinus]|uniref:Protein-L-isoaspartate O-methyltransferase n=1 Tax=Streptomyces paromomycinus TaxID=92743 RepID=A0A401W5E6_STREY|nr:ATP-grasp peptide maturase system methyltransferase [Streptomyces paromomycinus]GCD44516.1 SAM-dependent methyltransferase [Streptomyces paromomycinus]
MTWQADGLDHDAAQRRRELAQSLTGVGRDTSGWLDAVRTVPRHLFVPGFYLPADERDPNGLPLWEPVTAERDPARWLTAAYSDTTLITQFDGEEPDWKDPAVRHGGAPTSSSTLPSLVVRMWADADVRPDHDVLEIGTGSGYSTALACEYLGPEAVTSVEVDERRLAQAAAALYSADYTPTLAVADGLYGYWPEAPFDRIVAACSFRTVPPALIGQTRPGGKILLTLSGWLYGYARVLLTVGEDGTAEGPLLDGTVSFMSARTHAAPAFGNPAHWAAGMPEASREARHAPERITAATTEAFHLRFLAQSATPSAQLTALDSGTYLIDTVTGSAAGLTPGGHGWKVQQKGPVRLWDRIEAVIDAFDLAGKPAPATFRLRVDSRGQRLIHDRLAELTLP